MANDSLAQGAPRASYGPLTRVTNEWQRIFGPPEVGLYKPEKVKVQQRAQKRKQRAS